MTKVTACFLASFTFLAGCADYYGNATTNYSATPTQKHLELIEEIKQWAEQDDAKAQYALGAFYEQGYGVPQNHTKAREWYLKAAEQNYSEAQFNLGFLFAEGNGVPQDYAKAHEWYLKAAKQGNAKAQNNLATLYRNGDGVPQDYAKAYMWFNIAAANGNEKAAKNRNDGIPQEYIAEGQRLTREYVEQHPQVLNQ